MAFRAYSVGKEITDFYVGGRPTKQIWSNGVLLWEKGGKTPGNVWKFRYTDMVYFFSYEFIMDVDFGDGQKKENTREVFHESPGSHICTVTIIRRVNPDMVSLGFFLEFGQAPDMRYCQITETLSDVPVDVDQDKQNVLGTAYAFYNCSSLKKVHDTVFKNLVSSTQHISTFEGAAALEAVTENVYVHFEAPPVTFERHFYGCETLSYAPKLFEMFPEVCGRHCYNGCKKLSYYKDISFPWRTDIATEEVLTMVYPPQDNSTCQSQGGKITVTASVRPEMFKYATEATLMFSIGNGAGQRKNFNLKDMAEGTQIISAELSVGTGKYNLTVRIYANEHIYEEAEWEEFNGGYVWKVNIT